MRPAWAVLLCSAFFLGCPAPEDMPPGTEGGGEGAVSSESATSSSGESESEGVAQEVPQTTDAKHVKVGQVYHFRTQQPGMTIDVTWTVTAVEPELVRYDQVSTTTLEAMEGVAESPPMVEGPTPKVMSLTRASAPPAPGDPPQLVGNETLEISGVKFECEIYEGGGDKQWISASFPREIKREADERPLRELVKIE